MLMPRFVYPCVVMILVGCQSTGPTVLLSTDLPAEFSLRHGHEIVIGDEPLRLAFRDVLQDSRCPLDVVCVWEGNGEVGFGIALGTGAEQSTVLNTSLNPRQLTVGAYSVRLVRLDPDPISTSPIPEASYIAHLRVEYLPGTR
jgi:hypothetical protein